MFARAYTPPCSIQAITLALNTGVDVIEKPP